MAIVSVATLLFIVLAGHHAQANPVRVVACISNAAPGAFQIAYTHKYYSFTNIAVIPKFIGLYEATTTPRGVTLAYVTNGTDCDVYFGPGTSTSAQAINAVMNSAWMTNTVSGTEFSDRTNYPLFSRSVSTVDLNQRGIVTVMAQMKWTTVNILCTDNSYGQAVAQSIVNQLGLMGGTATPMCVSASALYATVESVVTAALASKTRVLFVAASSSDSAYTNGVKAIKALDATRRLIVMFSEAVCTNALAALPGVVCSAFAPIDARYAPFTAAFLSRDTTDEIAQYSSLGIPYSSSSANAASGYAALGVDGARLVYQAFDAFVKKYGTLPSAPLAKVTIIRGQALADGFLGTIEIPNGDRLSPAAMAIYNSNADLNATVIGDVTDGNLTISAKSLFVLGAKYHISAVPPAVDPVPPAEDNTVKYWASATAAGVLLLIVATAYYLRQRQLLFVRPLDPTEPFAVFFVGIKNADDIHDAGEASASVVFDRVAHDVRRAVRAHGCYEARRVDEATYMIVAKDATRALQCASAIMVAATTTDWALLTNPGGSNTGPRGKGKVRIHEEGRRSTTPTGRSPQTPVSSSTQEGSMEPAIHIGVHFGFGIIDHDEALGTVSYVGAVVNRAAVVADTAEAFQILVSTETKQVVLGDHATSSLGAFEEPDGWDELAPDTSCFVPAKVPLATSSKLREQLKLQLKAEWNLSGGGGGSGGIAAALQKTDTGLSMKRVGVAVIHVPALKASMPSAKASQILEEIAEAAVTHRAEIAGVTGSRVTIFVNVNHAASQPIVRAALVALQAVDGISAMGMECTAGVSGSTALVGRPTATAPILCVSDASDHACVAQAKAAQYHQRVCIAATGTKYEDLASRLSLVTLDALSLEDREDRVRLLSVAEERDNSRGEWMYTVTSSHPSIAANERAWAAVLDGATVPVHDASASQDCPELNDMLRRALAVSEKQLALCGVARFSPPSRSL